MLAQMAPRERDWRTATPTTGRARALTRTGRYRSTPSANGRLSKASKVESVTNPATYAPL